MHRTEPRLRDLATALALVLVIEGVLYALFPAGMRRVVAQVLAMPVEVLRASGLVATLLGVAAVWLIRH
jgi:uncharacterized protein YjeT (DUF2065 family)